MIWYKGDEEIIETGRYEILTDGRKRILVIQNAQLEDTGSYNCRLPSSRTDGKVKVHGMTITVNNILRNLYLLYSSFKCLSFQYLATLFFLELAAEFISKPQNLEILEGEKAEFVCTISKESFEVQWKRDDKTLESGDKYDIIADGKKRVLVVKDATLQDMGTYVVMVGAARAAAHLTVIGKFVFASTVYSYLYLWVFFIL